MNPGHQHTGDKWAKRENGFCSRHSTRRDTQDKEHSLVNAVDKVKGTENVKSHESSVIQTLHSDLLIHEADINLSESPV